MNLIKHLTNTVSSSILKADATHGETALLEKFYSILLLRMSDEDAYNTLSNHGKLSTKKMTLYKVLNNVDWKTSGAAKQISIQLAENHDMEETNVYSLMKQATPLVFTELSALSTSENTNIPHYLQQRIKNVDEKEGKAVLDYLPNWAKDILPANIMTEDTDKETTAEEEDKSDTTTEPSLKNETDSEASTKNTSEETTTTIVTDTALSASDTEKKADKELAASVTSDALPEPVHADASDYSYEKIVDDTQKTASPQATHVNDTAPSHNPTTENDGFLKGLLPIIGFLIFAALVWALLRGCQDSGMSIVKQNQQPNSSSEIITTNHEAQPLATVSNDSDQDTVVIAVTKSDRNNAQTESGLKVSVDAEGQLKTAEVQAGSNALGFQLNSAITTVFGDSALHKAKLTVNEDLGIDMPTMDKLNGLLLLVQNVPNASMEIEGEAIYFNAPDEASQNKLVNEAQALLSPFSIVAGEKPQEDIQEIKEPLSDTPESESQQAVPTKTMDTVTDTSTATDTTKPTIEADSPSDTANVNAQSTNQPLTTTGTATDKNNDSERQEDKEQNSSASKADGQMDSKSNIKDSKANTKPESTETVEKQPTDSSKPIEETTTNQPPAKKASEKRSDGSTSSKALDVATKVKQSISDSTQALDNLGNEPSLADIEKALNMQIINFASNGNSVPEENKALLNKAAKIIKRMDARLQVIGHTDADGNEDYNERLSQDRSFAVKKYLMSQGIASERIKADGVGERQPIASNSTAEGKFRNRRIEFKVIKPMDSQKDTKSLKKPTSSTNN